MFKILYILVSFLFLFGDENVTIQLKWKYQFQFAGFIMAKEKGFYKEVGLNVDLKEFTPNLNILDYVLSHKNSYGVGDGSLIYYILNKKPIKLLMPIYKDSPLVLGVVR